MRKNIYSTILRREKLYEKNEKKKKRIREGTILKSELERI